jgi:hypothetical protein
MNRAEMFCPITAMYLLATILVRWVGVNQLRCYIDIGGD